MPGVLVRANSTGQRYSECGRCAPGEEEGADKQHEEDQKEDLRDEGGEAGDAPKAEDASDDGNQQECECVA